MNQYKHINKFWSVLIKENSKGRTLHHKNHLKNIIWINQNRYFLGLAPHLCMMQAAWLNAVLL